MTSSLLVLALLFSKQGVTTYSQQGIATSSDQVPAELRARVERHRQIAIEINDLAGRIHSQAEADALVDKIAEIFADTLPPPWLTSGIRQRLARAEYAAVSDPSRLIPEQRIAEVWNEYVREIDASDEALVTVPELHNMRDADLATGQFLRRQGMNSSVWTISSIYAVDSEGKLADGCRALEALRILYDLDMSFDHLRGARERVRKGILASDEIKKRQEHPPATQKTTAHLEIRVDNNPIRAAESRYIQQHGPYVLNGVMEKLFDELFPPTD